MPNPVDAVIGRLRHQSASLWPDTPRPEITVAGKFVRPYSTVYQLRLNHANGSPRRVLYVKIFKPSSTPAANQQKYLERLNVEFETARQLQSGISPSPGFSIVRPVAYFPELLALVTEKSPGEPLAAIIEKSCKRWHPVIKQQRVFRLCERAGEALAAIQQATRDRTPFDPRELVEYMDVRLQRLANAGETPFTPEHRNQVLHFLKRAVQRVPAAQLGRCGSHCDYGPFNLLAFEDRVTVLDFSMYKIGSIYNDVTYFCHRLEGYLHKPIFSTRAIRGCQRAFLESYNRASSRTKRPVEEDILFQLFWLRHVVNNYSAIMRKRVVIGSERVSPVVRLFNQHVYRRYNARILRMCENQS